MRAREAIPLLAVFATISISIAAAQVSSASPQATDSHAVTITFFVQDEHGNPVSALQPSDLSVLDNGKPPVGIVSLASARELPLRLGILIDTNYELYYPNNKRAEHEPPPKWAVDFVEEMLTGSDDKAFIASYSTLRHGMTFVTRDQLRPINLNQFLKADTPNFLGLRDAIRVACTEVFKADTGGQERRILIVIPGLPAVGRSLSDYQRVISAAQRAGVKVLIPGWYAAQASMQSLGMRALVSETGGYDFVGRTIEYNKSQIDSMYSLTYVPAEPYRPGELRRLDLKTTYKSWHVHSPKRYLTPSAP